MSTAGHPTYSVHQGRLRDDLQLPSTVLHRVGATLTPLRTTEEEQQQHTGGRVSRASVPLGLSDRVSHVMIEMFPLQLRGCSPSEGCRGFGFLDEG